MKTTCILVFVLFLLSFAGASIAQPFSNARIAATTMGNGLRVVTLEDRSTNLVAVEVWVKAGAINETAENNGVSHFIEHLLFKRTTTRGPGEVDKQIESVGATLNAITSRDWVRYHTIVARRFLPTALDLLADIIIRPAFHPQDIERERRIILDEIARRDNDPVQLALNMLYAAAYTDHPYRMTEEGPAEKVRKLSRHTIQDYHSAYYVPNNMTVVLVGDIDALGAVSAVGQAFQGFQKKVVPPLKAQPEPGLPSAARKRAEANLNFSHLVVGFRAPSVYDEPDVYAMDVLITYMGLGYRSWMATELRETRNIATRTIADFLTQRHPGVVAFYLEVKPEDVEEAEKAVLAKIRDMRENPISEEALARAKRSLEGSYTFQNETFSGRANTLGFYESIKDYTFAVDYVANVRAVTAEDVQNVVKKYLDPDQPIVVVVGP